MKKLFILLAVVAFVVASTVPVMAAAEWNFYGSSRMSTFWDEDSKEVTGTGFDDDDLTWNLQGNSRIGAKVKAGAIRGCFEYGTGVNVRNLYGAYNFGAGEILVGQTYTPVNIFYSNQVYAGDTDLLPYGGIYNGRVPMIQLKWENFKLAAVRPTNAGGVVTGFAATDEDTSLPKLEASYKFNFGPGSFTLLGGYNTYDEVDSATDTEYGIDSYIYGLALKFGFGAFYLQGNIWAGQNMGPKGYSLWVQGDADPTFNAVSNDVIDNDSFGFIGVLGLKVNDMLSFEAGYGHIEHESDMAAAYEDETQSYYLQATINIAKGFFIVPEIGKIDFEDNSARVEQGDTIYFGAKWQINF